MKLGLDFHGVIDTHAHAFSDITYALIQCGNEVHIITGATEKECLPLLEARKIKFTHFFSITDHLIGDLSEDEVREKFIFDKFDRPLFDEKEWNEAKAIYCYDNAIDLHIDDTEFYNEYFKTPFCLMK